MTARSKKSRPQYKAQLVTAKVTRVPDRGLAKVRGHYYIEPVVEQLEYWGTNTENNLMLVAAHMIKELVKIIEAKR